MTFTVYTLALSVASLKRKTKSFESHKEDELSERVKQRKVRYGYEYE